MTADNRSPSPTTTAPAPICKALTGFCDGDVAYHCGRPLPCASHPVAPPAPTVETHCPHGALSRANCPYCAPPARAGAETLPRCECGCPAFGHIGAPGEPHRCDFLDSCDCQDYRPARAGAGEERIELLDALHEAALVADDMHRQHAGQVFENETLRARLAKYENDEGACCPEDVGFVEYIRTLEARLRDAERDAERLDWLENGDCDFQSLATAWHNGESVRAHIDAARGAV